MRQTNTKLIGIDISSKVFASYDEALKEANALKIYITRMIDDENKKGNSYSAFVIIGVSENNSHLGKMTLLKNKMRGRPKKVFVSTALHKGKTNPHLHIMVYANPADMIANRITEHLKKKYKQHICYKKYCDAYGRTSIAYIFKQSKAIRTVKRNRHNVLDSSYYQGLVDQSNSLERIIFTKTNYDDIAESIDITNDLSILDSIKKVVCNKPHSINTTDIVKKIDNIFFRNYLKFKIWKQAPWDFLF